MGKQQVTRLLEQLKTNQQNELQNAAAIFTVAQVAVNELREQVLQDVEPPAIAPPTPPTLALPPVLGLNRGELLQRYGSFNGCRKAAKTRGIKFSRTPSWQQLALAFSYADACQQLISSYVKMHPCSELDGIVTIELKLK